MPDESTNEEADPNSADGTDTTSGDGDKDWKVEHDRVLSEARKWEQRAKANKGAADELTKLRSSGMTDVDKAREEGKAEGRAEASAASSRRLVAAEVRAAAAGRKVDVDALLEAVDASRFIDDDGEPDVKRIAAWVDKLAPKSAADLGQGRRGTSKKTDMNSLIRERMRR